MMFFGVAFVLVAALSLGTIAWQVMQQYKLRDLPRAAGTMVSCEPVLSQTPDLPTSGNTPRAASMWTVRARYTYSVGGEMLQGHVFSQRKVGKISNRATLDDPAPASIAALCQQYAAGSSVQVYYRPEDPKNSFIYFNPPTTDWPWLIVPVGAGLLAAVFFGLAVWAKKVG